MNFLQLTQRLRRKCRVAGTGPTTVLNQNEEYSRLVDWTNEAWMIIQRKRTDWRWMRNAMSFPTVLSQAEYTLAQIQSTGTNFSNFGFWYPDTFRDYVTSVGNISEIELGYIGYDAWRDTYQMNATRYAPSRPNVFTVNPLLGIGLGPVPLDGYTITGDYQKVASEMAADADIPALPTQYHMAIVYRAMMIYGVSESAPEVYDEGQEMFDGLMRQIEVQQLPDFEPVASML